jgi:serine/threonine-protein kinase
MRGLRTPLRLSCYAVIENALKDRYPLINELGHGGSSVVFRARSAQNQREFAIKVTTVHVLLLTDGLYDLFVKASEGAANLRHPNIVNVHNVERKDDLFLAVTSLLDGQSLKIHPQGNGAPVATHRPVYSQAGR